LATAGSSGGCRVGSLFEAVIEGQQAAITILSFEGDSEETVGEGWVLRQQGSMKVSAEGVAVAGALEAAFAVVAKAVHHRGKRRAAGTQVGAAAVVLKAGQVAA